MKKLICLIVGLIIVKISVAQNVGIGTALPTQKLDVVGNLRVSGAIMPGGNAGTAGQVLISGGSNTSPVWSSAVETNIASKAFIPIVTNTGDVSSRGVFNNNSTALFQADSVDFGPVRYNLGADFTIVTSGGVGNMVTINSDGLYRMEGVITLLLQNANATLKPVGYVELLIDGMAGNTVDALSASELMPIVNVVGSSSYQKSFHFDMSYFFKAGDKFTFKGTIRNLASNPHDNIGIINPSYFSIYKISN